MVLVLWVYMCNYVCVSLCMCVCFCIIHCALRNFALSNKYFSPYIKHPPSNFRAFLCMNIGHLGQYAYKYRIHFLSWKIWKLLHQVWRNIIWFLKHHFTYLEHVRPSAGCNIFNKNPWLILEMFSILYSCIKVYSVLRYIPDISYIIICSLHRLWVHRFIAWVPKIIAVALKKRGYYVKIKVKTMEIISNNIKVWQIYVHSI